VCCSAVQCGAVRCSALQCVAVCCNSDAGLPYLCVLERERSRLVDQSEFNRSGLSTRLAAQMSGLNIYMYIHTYTYIYVCTLQCR